MTRHVSVLIVISAVLLVAAASLTRAQSQGGPAADGCAGAYVIGPDDVLDVSVWGNADISRTVPVRPDGRISLPLLNDLQASGLTPMELREALTEALKPYIPEPAVSVLVREIHSVKVAVIGQVRSPGRYEIKDRATVLDVLAMAGGLNEYADRGAIVVLRQHAGGTRQIPFAYDKLTARNGNGSKDAAALNFCVKAGDVILVP
jgi:polysaccharide export outer membrane protein